MSTRIQSRSSRDELGDGTKDAVAGDGAHPPASALAIATGLLVLALATAVLAFLPPIASAEAVAPELGIAVTVVVHGALALCLVGGAIGLILRSTAGWWGGVVGAAASALYQGKLLVFYLRAVNWEHRNADSVAWSVGLRYALPTALALALFFALLLPSIRARFGLRNTPYEPRRSRRS